jgi:hypothetical protein
MVGKIATGEIEDARHDPKTQHAREGGKKGGKARAVALGPKKRSIIAQRAAKSRWGKRGHD